MSRTSTPRPKPTKPFPSYPLTPHPNGQWCEEIRGKAHFFGVWADAKAALEEYNRQAADLHAGRQSKPRSSATLSIKELANHYLAAQQEKAERDLIAAVWFNDCLHAVRAFTQFVGKERPWDDSCPTTSLGIPCISTTASEFARSRGASSSFGRCSNTRTTWIWLTLRSNTEGSSTNPS